MPTIASAARADWLRRALDSVLLQQKVRAVPLVIVNGDQYDQALVEELEAKPELSVSRLKRASLPEALNFGVRQVSTEAYGFLDDDDELLPGALARRAEALFDSVDVDLVVTNGYRRSVTGQADKGCSHDTCPEQQCPLVHYRSTSSSCRLPPLPRRGQQAWLRSSRHGLPVFVCRPLGDTPGGCSPPWLPPMWHHGNGVFPNSTNVTGDLRSEQGAA
jgi:glycosyltransferase involved in cell wall biosynthesis